MPNTSLTPASPDDAADALAFALLFDGRRRVHDADRAMAAIVAKRLVEHLTRGGFVIMKGSTMGHGFNPPTGLEKPQG